MGVGRAGHQLVWRAGVDEDGRSVVVGPSRTLAAASIGAILSGDCVAAFGQDGPPAICFL
jgi:hypothetical protein